jgi:hypothetical protein
VRSAWLSGCNAPNSPIGSSQPPLRLAIVIVLAALLMTNLIDLARVSVHPA